MNSKLELRLEAVRLASVIEGVSTSSLIKTAKEVEKYVLGKAELPETYDPMSAIKSVTDLTMGLKAC